MNPSPHVIPAKAGIQCLSVAKTLGPRLRGDDDCAELHAATSPGKVAARAALALMIAASAFIPIAAAQGTATGAAALQPAESFASIADPKARAVALFTEAGKVLQHPRCVNCHPRTDRPLQGDQMRVHEPPVTRGKSGHGAVAMECATCHGTKNFDATSAVSIPGHENWHLAPIEMAWEGRSLGEICVQLKDRKRNGGKSMRQIVDHMANDSLVGWGWQPGIGRTPAPGTQQHFGQLIQAWVASGAHCPI